MSPYYFFDLNIYEIKGLITYNHSKRTYHKKILIFLIFNLIAKYFQDLTIIIPIYRINLNLILTLYHCLNHFLDQWDLFSYHSINYHIIISNNQI